MPDRSEPQVGIGFLSNSRSALEPRSSIHSRLVLERGDVPDDVLGQSAARVRAGGVGVGPAELVAAEAFELGRGRWRSSMRSSRRGPSGAAPVRCGTTWCRRGRRGRWWPGAARGCRAGRRKPPSRPRTAAGNSAATWATGQWCWHSWSPGSRGGRRRGETLGGQRGCKSLRPVLGCCSGDRGAYALHERGDPGPREVQHRVVAHDLLQVSQGVHGQVVVALLEGVPTDLGEAEHLGGTAPTASSDRTVGRQVTRLDGAVEEQLVEVPAHRGTGQPQPGGQTGRGRGPVGQQGADKSLPRAGCLHDFHNTIVT